MDHLQTKSDVYKLGAHLYAFSSRIARFDATRGQTWVQLAKVGEYRGHHMGEFAFTRESFERIIANFERQANDVPFYYGHPNRHDGQDPPAAGWISALRINGEWLEGLTRFTERATAAIAGDEYRHCSVVVDFESIDRVTAEEIGPEMFEVGLTNVPFIDGQMPIAFSRRSLAANGATKMDPQKIIDGLSKLLGIDAGKDKDKALSMLSAVFSYQAAMNGDEGEPAAEAELADMPIDEEEKKAVAEMARKLSRVALSDMPTEEKPEESTQLADTATEIAAGTSAITKLVEASGMTEAEVLSSLDANLDAIVALLKDASASGMPSDSAAISASLTLDAARGRLAATNAKIVSLAARVAEFEKREQDSKDAATLARVEAAIKSGHILADKRDVFVSLSKVAPKEFESLMADAEKNPEVPTGAAFAKKTTKNDPDETPSAKNENEKIFLASLPRSMPKARQAELMRSYRENAAKAGIQ